MIDTQDRTSQRLSALESANKVRTRNAQLKMQIACGSLDPVSVICERSEGIRVFDVLRSVRRVGAGNADQMLRAAGIDRRKRVDHLTTRQATVIAGELMEKLERLEARREAA